MAYNAQQGNKQVKNLDSGVALFSRNSAQRTHPDPFLKIIPAHIFRGKTGTCPEKQTNKKNNKPNQSTKKKKKRSRNVFVSLASKSVSFYGVFLIVQL